MVELYSSENWLLSCKIVDRPRLLSASHTIAQMTWWRAELHWENAETADPETLGIRSPFQFPWVGNALFPKSWGLCAGQEENIRPCVRVAIHFGCKYPC